MNNMSKKTNQRGFTLIELMIVVAIIGILAAVAVPKFAEMVRKSKEGASKGSLSALRSALTIYVSDNEGKAPLMAFTPSATVPSWSAWMAVMVPKYVESIPTLKLGTYLSDNNGLYIRVTTGAWDGNRSSDTPAMGSPGENGGWIYTSASEGVMWVSACRTDTKFTDMTTW